jgi:LysR family transcriptional regulator, transcriptional activator of nhaA
VRLVVHEDRLERLLADVATHALDVVLADAMPPPTAGVRVFGHLLAESNVGIFAAPSLASKLRGEFPRSLHGAPMLLPTEGTTLRRSLDRFLRTARVEPEVVAEIEDGALLKAFGQDGSGVFPAPLSLQKEIARQYGAKLVGEARGVVEQFYAITAERRFEHPALLAITESARAAMEARRTERPRRGARG